VVLELMVTLEFALFMAMPKSSATEVSVHVR
jgi:hypothetical protein